MPNQSGLNFLIVQRLRLTWLIAESACHKEESVQHNYAHGAGESCSPFVIYEAEEHNLEKQVRRKGVRFLGLETVASFYLNVKKKRF